MSLSSGQNEMNIIPVKSNGVPEAGENGDLVNGAVWCVDPLENSPHVLFCNYLAAFSPLHPSHQMLPIKRFLADLEENPNL
jgi:hypothetical protein